MTNLLPFNLLNASEGLNHNILLVKMFYLDFKYFSSEAVYLPVKIQYQRPYGHDFGREQLPDSSFLQSWGNFL